MAAISAVFAIGYVANLLDEDEDWLFDRAGGVFPEDSCPRITSLTHKPTYPGMSE